MNKEEFDKANIFGIGDPNVNFSEYFTGKSFLTLVLYQLCGN